MYNLSTKAHKGPQQPTKADSGPQRWKTAQCIFLKIYNLFTKAHKGPQQPTKLNAGPRRRKESPRRPTAANKGRRRPGLNSIIDLTNVYMYIFKSAYMYATRSCTHGVPTVYPYPQYPWLTEPEGRRVRVLTGTGMGQPGITRGLPVLIPTIHLRFEIYSIKSTPIIHPLTRRNFILFTYEKVGIKYV